MKKETKMLSVEKSIADRLRTCKLYVPGDGYGKTIKRLLDNLEGI